MTAPTAQQPETAKPAPEAEAPYPQTWYAWYVVIVLMLIYVGSFMDRQILSLIVDPIKKDLGISDEQMGFLMGPAFAVVYAIGGIPLGRLADRYSRKWIIAIGQIVWSLMSGACGLVSNYTQFKWLRMGLGVGEASLSPAAYSMITDIFPRDRLGAAMSVYSIGIYLGSGLSMLLGGAVVQYVSQHPTITLPVLGELRSWQVVFLVISAPVIPLTALLFTVKEPFRRGLMKRSGPAASAGEVMRYLRDNAATFLCHNLGFAMLSMSAYASAAWIPAFLKRIHGWDAWKVGSIYGTIVLIFGSLGIALAGIWADKLSRRGWRHSKMFVGLVSAVAWFPTGIAVMMTDNEILIIALLIPTIFTTAMVWGIAPAAISEISPAAIRGQTSAVYLMVINILGMGLGPLVPGSLNERVFAEHGDKAIIQSLLLVTIATHVIATILLAVGIKPFIKSLDYLKSYNERAARG